MKYKSKNHSKYFIMYHLIFVCKYRKKLLKNIYKIKEIELNKNCNVYLGGYIE